MYRRRTRHRRQRHEIRIGAVSASTRLTTVSESMTEPKRGPHRVSIVIPVYQGEHTLAALVEEIALLDVPTLTRDGHEFQVTEVLLVHDKGPDRSDEVIRQLAAAHDFIRAVWLSRQLRTAPGNAGRHGVLQRRLDRDHG